MKHDPVLLGSEDVRPVARKRRLYTMRRYWSRTYAVDFLRQTGELSQIGGEHMLRTQTTHNATKLMRTIGYLDVLIYDDNDPIFLGYPKNEPDYETIYHVLKDMGFPKLGIKRLRIIHGLYRTTGFPLN